MNHSMPGLPVHHQLPDFTETHVHRVSDAIQPSHPLSSPSPRAPNPSQHQSLSNESTLRMRWPKYWSFSFSTTRVLFLGQEDPLEKEMATHSSILAWEIPWAEEPGGLQSMGSQRPGTLPFHLDYVSPPTVTSNIGLTAGIPSFLSIHQEKHKEQKQTNKNQYTKKV